MSKHTTKIVYGYYQGKHGNEYRIVADRYSDGMFKVLDVFDEAVSHLIGKDLKINHSFRKARMTELPDFEGKTLHGEVRTEVKMHY